MTRFAPLAASWIIAVLFATSARAEDVRERAVDELVISGPGRRDLTLVVQREPGLSGLVLTVHDRRGHELRVGHGTERRTGRGFLPSSWTMYCASTGVWFGFKELYVYPHGYALGRTFPATHPAPPLPPPELHLRREADGNVVITQDVDQDGVPESITRTSWDWGPPKPWWTCDGWPTDAEVEQLRLERGR